MLTARRQTKSNKGKNALTINEGIMAARPERVAISPLGVTCKGGLGKNCSNLPDTVFRRGKKISGTLELDHIRLCFCFERWFAVTAVKEAGHEGSMVRSILMAIKHVRHPPRPCPRPCLPSGLMKVPPFDRDIQSYLAIYLRRESTTFGGVTREFRRFGGIFERPGEI